MTFIRSYDDKLCIEKALAAALSKENQKLLMVASERSHKRILKNLKTKTKDMKENYTMKDENTIMLDNGSSITLKFPD